MADWESTVTINGQIFDVTTLGPTPQGQIFITQDSRLGDELVAIKFVSSTIEGTLFLEHIKQEFFNHPAMGLVKLTATGSKPTLRYPAFVIIMKIEPASCTLEELIPNERLALTWFDRVQLGIDIVCSIRQLYIDHKSARGLCPRKVRVTWELENGRSIPRASILPLRSIDSTYTPPDITDDSDWDECSAVYLAGLLLFEVFQRISPWTKWSVDSARGLKPDLEAGFELPEYLAALIPQCLGERSQRLSLAELFKSLADNRTQLPAGHTEEFFLPEPHESLFFSPLNENATNTLNEALTDDPAASIAWQQEYLKSAAPEMSVDLAHVLATALPDIQLPSADAASPPVLVASSSSSIDGVQRSSSSSFGSSRELPRMSLVASSADLPREVTNKQWLEQRTPSDQAPDESKCSLCNFVFTTIKRRHHCRGCHLPVCGDCCQWLQLTPAVTQELTCTECFRALETEPRRFYAAFAPYFSRKAEKAAWRWAPTVQRFPGLLGLQIHTWVVGKPHIAVPLPGQTTTFYIADCVNQDVATKVCQALESAFTRVDPAHVLSCPHTICKAITYLEGGRCVFSTQS